MFALTARRVVAKAPLAQTARRNFGAPVNNLQVNGVRRSEDAKVWAREVGAYPVIAILTFACGFCATVGTRCLMKNTDVRIAPTKRQQLIRTWSN